MAANRDLSVQYRLPYRDTAVIGGLNNCCIRPMLHVKRDQCVSDVQIRQRIPRADRTQTLEAIVPECRFRGLHHVFRINSSHLQRQVLFA